MTIVQQLADSADAAETPAEKAASGNRELTPAALRAAIGVWIGFLVGPNVMLASTNGIFMRDLTAAFDVSRGTISGALAASVWLVGAMAPFAGRTMDRFGTRRMILIGATLFGACILGISQAQNFTQFLMLQVALAVAATLHGAIGYSKVAATWFDRHRGLVLGLCVAFGSGLGQIVMPKVTLALIEHFGWREAYMGIAAIVLLAGLPLIFALVRLPPDGAAAGNPVAAADRPGFTRAEALRQRSFYLVFGAIFFACLALIGLIQHIVPMLIERGLTPASATTVLSIVFVGVLLGESSAGIIIDRFNTPRVVLPYFAVALLGLLIITTASSMPVLLAGAVMMGLGLGCETGLNAYLTSRYFGLRNFGEIFGLTFLAVTFGIGTGLFVVGAAHDMSGSYAPAKFIVGGAMGLSLICLSLLGPFPFKPAKRH